MSCSLGTNPIDLTSKSMATVSSSCTTVCPICACCTSAEGMRDGVSNPDVDINGSDAVGGSCILISASPIKS